MENRRTQRFSLCLPVSITRSGPEKTTRAGVTRNISSGGVLFISEQEPDLGGPIEYTITLNPADARRVDVRCLGKVVRCIRGRNGTRYAYEVAATLERYEFQRAK